MVKETRCRKRSCWEAARARARQVRRKGMNPVLVALVFVLTFLSMMLTPALSAVSGRRQARGPSGEDWPVTDYERGAPGPLQHRRDGAGPDRYSTRPTMRRLMRDLRRPAARADAEKALLTFVPDADLRAWVSDQIGEGRINRLSIYAREGIPDDAVVAAWRAEFDNEKAAKAEAEAESRTQAHLLRALIALAGKESAANPTAATAVSRASDL